MYKCTRYGLILLLLHFSVLCFAQYDEDEADDTAAAVIQTKPVRVKDHSGFLPVGQQAPVNVRQVPAKKIEELKKEDDYWYASLEPKKKTPVQQPAEEEERRSLFARQWFRQLLWIIILCSFIAVVIWYLASSNILLFKRASQALAGGEEAAVNTDDIFAIDYEGEIQKAVQAGNYRLAVRLWYLRILKELSDRDLIDYHHEKTNSDFVNQLSGRSYYRDFFRLTRNFEYTWYGHFDLSAEAYEMMRTDFATFKNSLR